MWREEGRGSKAAEEASLICHTLTSAVILASVALLNKKSLASSYIANVGYIRDVMHVLPPCAKLSIIE